MRRSASLLALAAVAVAGCGEKTVKTGELRDAISAQFKAQGVALRDIACPDEIKAETGAAINCTAVNPAGTKLFIEGRVTEVDGDRARFNVRAVRGVAKGTTIAAQARELLEQRVGQKAQGMTCPAQIEIPTRPSVTCELTTRDGKRYDTTVTIDENTQMNVEVADTPK